ncbi:MAG: 4-hydroxythreonine-4-phosphate dehydrogenase PdxA [Proteobacteria bacterium]|nr:4-hydroxythreonine-4-phosphate dehydrogenase PdxA [Pseudomonadota bacterium]
MDRHKPLVGITLGDPAGIGPEVLARALATGEPHRVGRPVVIGDPAILRRGASVCGVELTVRTAAEPPSEPTPPGTVVVLDPVEMDPDQVAFGQWSALTGRASAAYFAAAVDLARNGRLDALVTGPIQKEAWAAAGVEATGHTTRLQKLTGVDRVVMMLAGDRLKVALATIHHPLKDVPGLLTTPELRDTIILFGRELGRWFGYLRPRLGVAGLNPHAGEGGLFGDEEARIIAPAIEAARRSGLDAVGPLPPDTVFFRAAAGEFDAVVAMYHDQGLIPLKLLHFHDAVNVTLGLPFPRTSVDHGTALDIAGAGRADPGSMLAAIRTAAFMAERGRSRPEE